MTQTRSTRFSPRRESAPPSSTRPDRLCMYTITVKPLIRGHLTNAVKPVMRGHPNKCPYMTGVPSSQVHFNVKVHLVHRQCNLEIPTGVPSSQVHFNVKVHLVHRQCNLEIPTGVPSSQVHFNVKVHLVHRQCNLEIPTGVPSSQVLLYAPWASGGNFFLARPQRLESQKASLIFIQTMDRAYYDEMI